MNFEEQVRAAGLPADAQVTVHPGPSGDLYRLTYRQGGAELLLTDEARRMYGEGPSVAMVLTRLRQALDEGLPPLQGEQHERIVFLGD